MKIEGLEKIREARERAGLSQTELAKRVGVYPNSVSAMEHGRRRVSPRFVDRVAGGLGLELRMVVKEKGASYRPKRAPDMILRDTDESELDEDFEEEEPAPVR